MKSKGGAIDSKVSSDMYVVLSTVQQTVCSHYFRHLLSVAAWSKLKVNRLVGGGKRELTFDSNLLTN